MSLVEHLEKLRHFSKVTTYRSINEAAQGIGMSQAGLSKSIASLEAVLGIPLFVRSQGGIILTKEGEILLRAAKKILAEATDVEFSLRALKAAQVPEKIRVGMYDSIAVYFFPELLSYLNSIYRDLEVELVVHQSSNLAALIKNGELDLAIGVYPLKTRQNMNFSLLFEDHYSFFASSSIAQEVERLPLIFNPHAMDENGIAIETLLQPVLKRRLSHRVYNFETLKSLTVLGLGVGMLPTKVAKPLVLQRQLTPVIIQKTPNLFGKHKIGFYASSKLLNAHQDFIDDIYRLGERWSKT